MDITTTSASAPTHAPAAEPVPASGKFKLLVVALIIVAISEWIGVAKFKLGPGDVVLLPMVWALLLAALWGILQGRLPNVARIETATQGYANSLLNAGLSVLVVKLCLTVGGSFDVVMKAGWALIFQEFGHAVGTLALGLPIALILGLKREAVGATFSVGREGSLIIIGQRYGMASPEGRGVLAEYVTGTVVGALFIATLAGFLASLGIFDPRSLAMGAGVGSASLMAAALGAVAAHSPAEMLPQLTALAAAANLLVIVCGLYTTLFISLPLCNWLYRKLEPVLGRLTRRGREAREDLPGLQGVGGPAESPFTLRDTVLSWIAMGLGVTLANMISYKGELLSSLEGMLVLIVITAALTAAKRLLPRKIPFIVLLAVGAALIGIPGWLPLTPYILAATGKINFLPFTTIVLALAGFSVAKDLPMFRRLGWRIVVVSLAAETGTFLCAAMIAEFFHR
ncbi:MAG: DUF3100 domain-containing protein [Xenophilus sp.]